MEVGGEALEERILLANPSGFADLGVFPPDPTANLLPQIAVQTTTTNSATGVTTITGPFGVVEGGRDLARGAGFSVKDLGDINGDGFDDFLVGAPTVTSANGTINLAGGSGKVYLIFGSLGVTNGVLQNTSWLNLTFQQTNTAGLSPNNQRVGDLANLGNDATLAFNPITGSNTFPFAGISFITSQSTTSQLGASVSVVRNLPGGTALLIGAPGEPDQNGAFPNTGRAYLIYINQAFLNYVAGPNRTTPIDLDSPNSLPAGFAVVTFTNLNSLAGTAQTGFSVAGLGDIFGNGTGNIAIGAPNANIAGGPTGLLRTGAVYVLAGVNLPTTTATIPLQNVGQNAVGQIPVTPVVPGVLFLGGSIGAQAGFSLADAGDVDGNRTTLGGFSDLLIGSPGADTGGAAYLIYGSTTLATKATLSPSAAVNSIPLNTATLTAATFLATPGNQPGAAIFNGLNAGAETGFSVASAGDFNNDTFGDFMIGSPFANETTGLSAGELDLVFGGSGPAIPTVPASLRPQSTAANPAITLPALGSNQVIGTTFIGNTTNSFAGYSSTAVGNINNDTINEIAIGQPGWPLGFGSVFIVPGRTNNSPGDVIIGLTNPIVLNPTAQPDPVLALFITISNTEGSSLAGAPSVFLGASLSGVIRTNPAAATADSDILGDLIIGAPGYQIAPNRFLAGGVFFIEGGLLQSNLPLPLLSTPSTSITPTPTPTTTGLLAPLGAAVPLTVITPQFGPDKYVPTIAALSAFNSYKPIPLKVALNQYLPPQGFRQRITQYFFPKKYVDQFGSRKSDSWARTSTLAQDVFSRGRFKAGKTISFTHPVPVVPIQLQHQTFIPTPNINLVRKRSND
jgi:hypothetical protein